jgi:hypothetical protein
LCLNPFCGIAEESRIYDTLANEVEIPGVPEGKDDTIEGGTGFLTKWAKVLCLGHFHFMELTSWGRP